MFSGLDTSIQMTPNHELPLHQTADINLHWETRKKKPGLTFKLLWLVIKFCLTWTSKWKLTNTWFRSQVPLFHKLQNVLTARHSLEAKKENIKGLTFLVESDSSPLRNMSLPQIQSSVIFTELLSIIHLRMNIFHLCVYSYTRVLYSSMTAIST